MEVDKKLDLITRNLQEVLGEEKLIKILKERDLKVCWGTATTERPHVACFVPMCKIADFLEAGCEVTILLADLHAELDNMKVSEELVQYRSQFYEEVIKSSLKAIGAPLEKLKFANGTSYRLSFNYALDFYKLSTLTTEQEAMKATADVIKQTEDTVLDDVMYPCFRALDEQYLEVDAQLGGVDQRKIFVYAEEYLPKLGYDKKIHLISPKVPGLTGSKMNSSEEDSNIDLLDSVASVKSKIKKALCEPGNVENNGLLSFVKSVLFQVQKFKGEFKVDRPEKFGGPVTFSDYESLESAFAKQEIHPGDLKGAVEKYLNELLEPVRKDFACPEKKKLIELAFPSRKAAMQSAAENDICPSVLELRVGNIEEVRIHPTSNKMYEMTVDFGDKKLMAASALVQMMKAEDLRGHLAIFLCNLKSFVREGVEYKATLLCAFGKSKAVELLVVPEGSKPGDQVFVDGFPSKEPTVELSREDWVKLQADLKSNEDLNIMWRTTPVVTALGPVRAKSMKNVPIK